MARDDDRIPDACGERRVGARRRGRPQRHRRPSRRQGRRHGPRLERRRAARLRARRVLVQRLASAGATRRTRRLPTCASQSPSTLTERPAARSARKSPSTADLKAAPISAELIERAKALTNIANSLRVGIPVDIIDESDSMKTTQLLNYDRDRWVAGEGGLAEIASAIDGAPVAMTGSGGLDFGAMLRHAREVGGPALRKLTFHERARMHQGARPRDHGPQGGAVRAQLSDRRDAQGRLDRHRGRRRHALLLLVQGPPRAARRPCPARRPARAAVEERHASSASTSTPRCRARRCTSTPSTSRSGGCWKSSRRPCSRACRRSSSRPQLDRLSVRSRVPGDDRSGLLPPARSS